MRLRLLPMPTMAPTATAWPITAMAMVLPTMDMATPMPMATMDTTARGLLMLRPPPPLMLMLTMPPMPMLTTDTAMDSLITVMATMDTTAMLIPMPTMDTMA